MYIQDKGKLQGTGRRGIKEDWQATLTLNFKNSRCFPLRMALLSPANPKFSQEEHRSSILIRAQLYILMIGENSPIVSRSQGVTFLPSCVCFKCSRCSALLIAPKVTGAGRGRTGTLRKILCHVSFGRVPFWVWRAAWSPKPDDMEPALGEHSCLTPGPLKQLTLLPSPDSKQQNTDADATAVFMMCQVIHLAL